MTELAIVRENRAPVAASQDAAIERLGAWAQSAQAAYKVAESICDTTFVPSHYRGKPMEATAAILTGLEVGLSPMAALNAFDPIQGKSAPKAITQRAIAQSFGHEVEIVESTATRCRVRGRRKGADAWQELTWTIEQAQTLGLAGKDNWKKQPTAMLVARATSAMCRLIAADAMLGIGYSAEEIADGFTGEAEVVAAEAAPSTRRMSRRKPEPEAAAEPVLDEDGQRKAMFAAFRDAAGFAPESSDEGRAERLAYISRVIDREVESSNDMTWDERSRVIDSLRDAAHETLDGVTA